jgi:hypothetical protein
MKIDIIQIIEKKDGTSEVIFDYDEEFLKYVKLKTGKKRPTKKQISEVFLTILDQGLEMLAEQQKEESND